MIDIYLFMTHIDLTLQKYNLSHNKLREKLMETKQLTADVKLRAYYIAVWILYYCIIY